jgi:hypothetical protein
MKIKHDKPVINQTRTYFCNAYGCRLYGSMGTSTDGYGKFYCRFHYSGNPQINDKITLKIAKNAELLTYLDKCNLPELFYKGDAVTTFFTLADEDVKEGLNNLGLNHLYVKNNLYKTSKNIIVELNERIL